MNPRLLRIAGPAGELAVHEQGDDRHPTVLFSHSILSSSSMWDRQAAVLARSGWHVLRLDTRGHGASEPSAAPYTMEELVGDTVAVLDALDLESVHFVGLSLGGMIGFGLGISHPHRLDSLLICDARADAPPPFAAPWDERIAIAAREGCGALAEATAQRWFGASFLQEQPAVARRVRDMVAGTTTQGFIGCARALQRLDYLPRLHRIETPTTLLVGADDGPLPEAMAQIAQRIPGAVLEVIPDAGHLPNLQQPVAFDAALLRHLARVARR